MLDTETKRRVDTARDILVGKVPNPQSQVEQITIALIYKFMDDMDSESEDLGGEPSFFIGEYEKFGWRNIFSPSIGGFEMLNLYSEAIQKMAQNPHLPQLFRDIFKNAYLPYRDPETLKSFLKIINDFSYDHSEKLGDAFEYLLSVLGSQGDAGQFRTPRHIIEFMTALINPLKTETILDPACGTAGFLISAYKHILKNNSSNYKTTDPYIFEQNNVKLAEITLNGKHYRGDKLTPEERSKIISNIKGCDISPDMVRLSLVNLYLHGFTDPHIYEYDTLTSEERWNEYYDIILANPPFMSPKGGIRPHKRFSIESKRSEVLFVDYMMEHLTPIGRAAIIVPEGIIFQTGTAYKSLRKKLIEENYLVGVISLPSGVFNPYSGVKTSILWLDKVLAKKTDNIIFAKIENDGFDLGAQRRPIKQNDFPSVFKELIKYKDGLLHNEKTDASEELLVSLVDKKKIAEKGEYNLSGDRYNISKKLNAKYDWKSIGSILDFINDGDWIESKDQSDSGIRLLQTGNIGQGEYLDKPQNAKYINEDTFKRLNCKAVYPGDVLLSRLPDPVGRSCIVPNLNAKLITAVDCTILRFNKEKILPTLFVNYCKSDLYYENIKPFLTGASRRRISRKNLETVKIPIPPLPIQEEIVAEIESYQKIIDGARQVVENYKPKIDIDPDWEMVELGEVCTFVRGPFGGSLKKEIFVENGYAVYEQSHAISNNFNSFRYYVDDKKFQEMKRFEVSAGDIIMSCSGTMGKVAIVPENTKKGIINQALLKLTVKDNLRNIYLKLWMESENFQETLKSNVYGAAIQNVASVKVLQNLLIPLPSLKIQDAIIKMILHENRLVNASREVMVIFEQKIKDRIDKVLGE